MDIKPDLDFYRSQLTPVEPVDDATAQAVLVEGEAVAAAANATTAARAGRRVRVIRTVVYEGTAESVERTLTRSLTTGVHRHHRGALQLTVCQGPIMVLPPDED